MHYQSLSKKIEEFQQSLNRHKENTLTKSNKTKEELAELQEYLEEKNNYMISKIQDLKRKQTIIITIKKIQYESPEENSGTSIQQEKLLVPENFPKNYYLQILYEDATLTGNNKFIDFDENMIEQKFVLPLLFTTIVKVQLWLAEEEPVLFDKADINLEKDIENALIADKYAGQLYFQKLQNTAITYELQIQGIGFSSWLKNISEMRQLEQDKAYSHEQNREKKERMRKKLGEKKERFKALFARDQIRKKTNEYDTENMNKILEELNE